MRHSNRYSNPDFWSLLAATRFFLAAIIWSSHMVIVTDDPIYSALSHLGTMTALVGFFVISGFSIAHSLEASSNGFYLRRVSRVYPTYLVCYLAIITLFAFDQARHIYSQVAYVPKVWDVLANFFLLQTFVARPILGPSWSLAVEFWFYIIAPRLQKLSANIVYIFAIASGLFYLYGHRLGWNEFVWPHDNGLKACLFAWAWLAGFMLYRERDSLKAILFVAAGIPMVQLYNAPYLSSLTFLVVVLILLFGNKVVLPAKLAAFFNELGGISYPLYLSHVCVFVAMRGVLGISSGLVTLIVCLAVSAIIYRFIDRPWQKKIRQWSPSRSLE